MPRLLVRCSFSCYPSTRAHSTDNAVLPLLQCCVPLLVGPLLSLSLFPTPDLVADDSIIASCCATDLCCDMLF